MEDSFTEEEIINALRQADANIDFEEVDIFELEAKNTKVLRMEKKNERNRSN